MAAWSAAALLGAADWVGIDRSFSIAVLVVTTVPQNAQCAIFPVAEFPGRRPAAYESNPEDVPGPGRTRGLPGNQPHPIRIAADKSSDSTPGSALVALRKEATVTAIEPPERSGVVQ